MSLPEDPGPPGRDSHGLGPSQRSIAYVVTHNKASTMTKAEMIFSLLFEISLF